jgi:hypothetical protein
MGNRRRSKEGDGDRDLKNAFTYLFTFYHSVKDPILIDYYVGHSFDRIDVLITVHVYILDMREYHVSC